LDRIIKPELERFTTALWLERGLSDNTCQAYRRDVEGLDRWLSEHKHSTALSADESDVQAYLGCGLLEGVLIGRFLGSYRVCAVFISTW